jgi:uncharacterized protein YggE
MKRAGIAALLALLTLPLASACGSGSSAERTITVSDTATVRVMPNLADLSFGVTTTAATAKEALAANSTRMTAVIAALKKAGIAPRDIQTEQVNIYPASDQSGTITSYSATNSVAVKVRRIGDTSRVIDRATAAGANVVNGPTFSREHPEAVYRQALAAAYDKAEKKARAMAEHVGLRLGKPVSIQESGEAPIPVYAPSALRSDKGSATPIEPGRAEVTATVLVSFELH